VAKAKTVVVRGVRADEGARLKEIAIAAKAHWGYELDKVREWANQGDFSAERLSELVVFVAEAEGEQIGWASLEPRPAAWWLEDLWIEPAWIGKGVGGQLFRHAARHAQRSGAAQLEWEAEPNAIGFYERMGGKYVRNSTSEWGRTLSVMGVDLRA
jgi:GNAT superfamily N-acetyltransferase